MKGHPVWYEQQGLWVAQVVHAHQTSRRLSWPRGFGALNSSPHSWIFTSGSVGSSPRCYLFTSATGRIGVHTAPKYGKKPIRYLTLHFRDRLGTTSLRHRSLTVTTVLMCEQKPYLVWFSWRHKRYPVRVVDIPLAVQWRRINVHKRLDVRAELLFWLLNPLRPPLPSPSWLLNPLSPNVTNINFLLTISIHRQEIRLWELTKWSPKRKYLDLLSNSLNLFFKERPLWRIRMWILGLKGLKSLSWKQMLEVFLSNLNSQVVLSEQSKLLSTQSSKGMWNVFSPF